MRPSLFCLCAMYCVWATPLYWPAEESSDLKFTVRQIGPTPLPLQAVQFRWALSNRNKKTIGDLNVLEASSVSCQGMKGPDGERISLTLISGPAQPMRPNAGTTPTALDHVAEYQRLVLKPGEEEAVTGALVGSWDVEKRGERKTRFLFPKPGKYSLRYTCRPRRNESDSTLWSDWTTVTVAKPEGDDATIYKLLQDNTDLAEFILAAYTWSYLPDRDTRKLAESIVEKYPKSSYADFARFALARAYVYGDDPPQMKFATDKEREQSLKVLHEINVKDFPCGAEVLLFEMKLTSDAPRLKQIRTTLNREFIDSSSWISKQADEILPGGADEIGDEDRQKLEKQFPKTRGPRKKQP